jgi:transcriptional regulator with XRE-family HTH domain
MEYTATALGAAIRSRREGWRPKMSQEKLGADADYGKGAGVSISRIESGQSRPTPDKLARIADVLGVAVGEIEREAVRLTEEPARSESRSTKQTKPLKQRVETLQRAVEDRTTEITELADAFNAAHDKARDEFFMSFVEAGRQIEGAPPPPEPSGLTDEQAADPAASAAYRLGISSCGVSKALGTLGGVATGTVVGGATAYTAFTAVAAFGTASTGAAISGLSGAAGTSAALAWFGGGSLAASGAGVAGGTMVLAGIVAAPAAVLAVGGFIWMARRSKQKDAELLAKVEQAEGEIEATQPGFDALCGVLPQATTILDNIVVHGGRAQKRWNDQLGPLPVSWSALSSDQQNRYLDFIHIAACQLTAASINPSAFMTVRGAELKAIVENTRQDLEHATVTIDALI